MGAGFVWREDRIADLLASEVGPTLYVSGTVSNQGRFYPRFDEIVLLSAPVEIDATRSLVSIVNQLAALGREPRR